MRLTCFLVCLCVIVIWAPEAVSEEQDRLPEMVTDDKENDSGQESRIKKNAGGARTTNTESGTLQDNDESLKKRDKKMGHLEPGNIQLLKPGKTNEEMPDTHTQYHQEQTKNEKSSESIPSRPPNIILMMADDLGIGDIGCFGNTTLRTPNIDRLAKEGVRLNHDLAAAAICVPSRAAFQTGRYPIRMGMVPHNLIRVHLFASCSGGLPEEEVTLGEVAKSKGLKTAFIGKWHLGLNCHSNDDFCHHPLNQGYDYFYGLPMSNAKDFGDEGTRLLFSRTPYALASLIGTQVAALLLLLMLLRFRVIGRCGFLSWNLALSLPLLLYLLLIYTGPRGSGMVMRNFEVIEQPIILPGFTDRLIREGVQYLTQRQEDGAPFLLVMSWIQVHTALHAVRPYRGQSKHGPYGDEVEEMDWSVGEILKALDLLGLADNTLVYFTSDHGGHLEEKGIHGNQEGGWNGIYKGGKGMGGMEGGIHVPTVMRWPNVIPNGSEINVPTSHMDILPTLASIIGADLPSDRPIDGIDISRILKGYQATPPHEFLVHYCGELVHAVRYIPGNGSDIYKAFYATHRFKPDSYECDFVCLCEDRGITWHDPPILYNVGRDPHETRPLDPDQSETRIVLQEISTRLDEHKASIATPKENQFSYWNLMPKVWLQVCCNLPYCKCTEPDYRLQS